MEVEEPSQVTRSRADSESDNEDNEEPAGPHHLRNMAAFFILGTINNLFYVVVNSGNQVIVQNFTGEHTNARDMSLQMVVMWANIGLGIVARGASFVFEGISFNTRVIVCGLISLLGLFGIGTLGEYPEMCIPAIACIGFACTLGESTLVAYVRKHQPALVGGWSSGTGVAGVLGTSLFIAFKAMKLSVSAIFLLQTPLILLYYFAFFWMIKPDPKPSALSAHRGSVTQGERDSSPYRLMNCASESSVTKRSRRSWAGDGDVEAHDGGAGAGAAAPSPSGRYMECLRLVWWIALQIGLVYLLEYVIQTVFALQANTAPNNCDGHLTVTEWFECNAYETLSWCYQVGVLISRSSLSIVKIKRVGVLTFLQFILSIVWFFIAWKHIVGVWPQFALMICVGLMGGASYVNCFYVILKDKRISKENKEPCVNIAALAINIGVLASCGISTFFAEIVFK
eukprot:gnl/Spiro4/13180_TR6989_c0_g1_i1.p1 gnl/Spiro4/13180_TR6989_c0_g1~~gnl/Spiro4/13180_TR6989_c0_g1_i1.p1  ORF type:complete len:470 (-),score=130.14 gnl/Spiro4/13180_TR6989_c0_g1_i1:61-1422(-)